MLRDKSVNEKDRIRQHLWIDVLKMSINLNEHGQHIKLPEAINRANTALKEFDNQFKDKEEE